MYCSIPSPVCWRDRTMTFVRRDPRALYSPCLLKHLLAAPASEAISPEVLPAHQKVWRANSRKSPRSREEWTATPAGWGGEVSLPGLSPRKARSWLRRQLSTHSHCCLSFMVQVSSHQGIQAGFFFFFSVSQQQTFHIASREEPY